MMQLKTWNTPLVTIQEEEFDHDLHAFEVYDKSNQYLGRILPNDAYETNVIKAQLDSGACPIADGWEDDMGNVCTLEGWE